MKYYWKREGTTVAGGDEVNQLHSPRTLYMLDNSAMYIADHGNHCIFEWKLGAKNGKIVAGGEGYSEQVVQLDWPERVVHDKKNGCLIISEPANRRIFRWPLHKWALADILVTNVDVSDFRIDKEGYFYTSDIAKHEVRRWKLGDEEKTLVAGGNGRGERFDQLNCPNYIFVDDEQSVYVSDEANHRVMKWAKDAKEGVVVAGGNDNGSTLAQLSYPRGIFVDQLGNVFVADFGNSRVMRWLKGAKHGTLAAGGQGYGRKSNQLSHPTDIALDRDYNLYVVDRDNRRVQKYDVELK